MKAKRLNNYKEGVSFVNNELSKEQFLHLWDKEHRITMSPAIYWGLQEDILAIKMGGKCVSGDTVFFEYELTQIFEMEGLGHSFADFMQQITDSDALEEVVSETIGFYRGALAMHLKGTVLSAVFFPIVDVKEFISQCKIVDMSD